MVFAGGSFVEVGGEPVLALARLDPETGTRDSEYLAQVQSPGIVHDLVRQPDGKTVVGGRFSFAGLLHRRGLVRLLSDGTVDPSWNPQADDDVFALAATGSHLYVAGSFSRIGGIQQPYLARFSTTGSDAADGDWRPHEIDGSVGEIAVSDESVNVRGRRPPESPPRSTSLIKISTTGTGSAEPLWRPLFESDPSTLKNAFVSALTIVGDDLYVGGEFWAVNGIQRNSIARLSLQNGSVDPNWNPNPQQGPLEHTYVYAIAVEGDHVFVGGHFSQIGGHERDSLAKLSATGIGEADPLWNPLDLSCCNFVNDIKVVDDTVHVGGRFIIRGGAFLKIANFSVAGDGYEQPTRLIEIRGGSFPEVRALLVNGRDVIMGGRFSEVGGFFRASLASIPVAEVPVLRQVSSEALVVERSPGDGPDVTHFLIRELTGGRLFSNDGSIEFRKGDFIAVEEGQNGMILDEGATVSIASALYPTLAGAGSETATLTIVAGGQATAAFRLASTLFTVNEDGGEAVVTVRKLGRGEGTIDFSTSSGTAVLGTAFEGMSGTLTFAESETEKTVVIPILDNALTEGDKAFTISLIDLSIEHAVAGTGTALIRIIDDEIVGLDDSAFDIVAPLPFLPPTGTGSLTVFLEPSEALGQWRLVGDPFSRNSGTTVGGLTTGSYRVAFAEVNGFLTPLPRDVPIDVEAAAVTLTGFYTSLSNQATGDLTVLLENDRGEGGWRLRGEEIWRQPAEILSDVLSGSQVVENRPVEGLTAPAPQLVIVGPHQLNTMKGVYLSSTPPASETLELLTFEEATQTEPFPFVGQVASDLSFGSGVLVKPRVVLTAAHLLFDDRSLSYVTSTHWLHQKYTGKYEPVPLAARGWYVLDGYAAQRELDASPGVSTRESQGLDSAALYFLTDAGRGGSGGFLTSNTDPNEWLVSDRDKMLVGYPVEGIDEVDVGKPHASEPANLTFEATSAQVYATSEIRSSPGASGGPLYVRYDNGNFYPAGIYLGGDERTLVRAIDQKRVDLINRADITGGGGPNHGGNAGIGLFNPGVTFSPFTTGNLKVLVQPEEAGIRARWKVRDIDDTFVHDSGAEISLIAGGFIIEFAEVEGFEPPPMRIVLVGPNQLTVIEAVYQPESNGGGAAGPFGGGDDLGGGWRHSEWFGFYNDSHAPWYFHNEHWWLYSVADDADSIWLWQPELLWLWTSEAAYPYLYRNIDQAWLFYSQASTNPRWFFNFESGAWEALD